MNKGAKTKNSSKVTHSSRNLTAKYSSPNVSHTPTTKKIKPESRRKNIEKFKSIPTITYRDVELY